MTKWADYGISAVRYNTGRTHIEQVKAHVDNGTSIGTGSAYSRAQVVSALKQGKTFVTILYNSNQQWTKGQPVQIITVNGAEYLKTTSNGTAADNLESLPEF